MMEPIRVIELFAGIGAQHQALKQANIPHDVVAISEIDPGAVRAYEAIHGKVNNLGDITKVEHLPDCDLLTYSFPCQDLSIAGKMKGMAKESGTRSGLLWEVERLLADMRERECLPNVLLMENVDAILFETNIRDFMKWVERLSEMGYTSSYKVLDAADYGVPQRRNRCFMISLLDGRHYTFPKGIPLEKRLKDVLEDNVDESYYLSDEQISVYIAHDIRQRRNGNGFRTRFVGVDDMCPTITTNNRKSGPVPHSRRESIDKCVRECELCLLDRRDMSDDNDEGQRREDRGIQMMFKDNTKSGYVEGFDGDGICLQYPTSTKRRGRIQRQRTSTLLTTGGGQGVILMDNERLRIRTLTPRECWRLMGFSDDAYDKASKVCTKTELYRQAGNSIVVDVLVAIFDSLYNGKHPTVRHLEDY